MSSPADRFTRLQKIAIFLLVLGEKKARQILAGLNLESLQKINAAIAALGEVTPQEKAAVMIEFGEFFSKKLPLKSKGKKAKSSIPAAPLSKVPEGIDLPGPAKGFAIPFSDRAKTSLGSREEDLLVYQALQHLRQRVDPGQIDWGRAGYDFGEGFKGSPQKRD